MGPCRDAVMLWSVLAAVATTSPAWATAPAARSAPGAPANKEPPAMPIEISGWLQVDFGGDAQVFYRSQGGRSAGLRRAYVRLERETPDPAYPHFLSKVSLLEFDCAAKTRLVILSTLYAGKHETGRAYIGARAGWAPVTAGSVEEAVMKLVCGRD